MSQEYGERKEAGNSSLKDECSGQQLESFRIHFTVQRNPRKVDPSGSKKLQIPTKNEKPIETSEKRQKSLTLLKQNQTGFLWPRLVLQACKHFSPV